LSETLNGCVPKSLDAYQVLEVTAYPNPTSGKLTIELESGFKGDRLQIVDLTGRLILEMELWGSEDHIDLSNNAEGTYLMLIELDDVVIHKKIILSH
jgi:hypothetical protein